MYEFLAYRATSCRAALVQVGTTAVLAVGVLAGAAHAVTLDLDGEVKLLVRGRGVLEDREPCGTIAVADTKVERSEVTPWVGGGAPLAGLLDRDTGWVDVVLSGGAGSLPLVVVVGRWAGQVGGRAWLSVDWDGLRLGARVVSTANSNVLRELVLDEDGDLLSTLHAEALGHAWVGEMELAVLALDTSNRLASRALSGGPLRLLVTRWAGVGAVVALRARSTRGDSLDVGEATSNLAGAVLDTGPSTKTEPVNSNSAVLRGESRAVDLTIGEVGVNASRTAAPAARAARAARVTTVAWDVGGDGGHSAEGLAQRRVGRRRSRGGLGARRRRRRDVGRRAG